MQNIVLYVYQSSYFTVVLRVWIFVFFIKLRRFCRFQKTVVEKVRSHVVWNCHLNIWLQRIR